VIPNDAAGDSLPFEGWLELLRVMSELIANPGPLSDGGD
jgi:hypothetical protein